MYEINRTYINNDPIRVNMTDVLTQGGLKWVGQFHSRYGEILHENMLRMHENFASNEPPWVSDSDYASFNKLNGVIWYDMNDNHTGEHSVKIQKGDSNSIDGWKRLEITVSNTPPSSHAAGEVWYDTRDNTFSLSRNTLWEDLTVKRALDSDKLNNLESWQFLRTDIDDTAYGTLTLSNVRPRSNSNFNLGTPSNLWLNTYTDNLVANTTHSLIPKGHIQYDLGSNINKWGNLYVGVLRADQTRSLIPQSNTTYDLGSTTRKWRRGYIRDLYADFSHNLIPINGNVQIGVSNRRWKEVHSDYIVGVNYSSLIPQNTNNTIGDSTKSWAALHVNVVKSTRTENLRPVANNSYDLGTNTERYRRTFTDNLRGNLRFEDNINFDIVRNGQSKRIHWSGLTDSHSIYVEEVDNNETTRLIFDSRDNANSDIAIFRQGGSGSPVKDVMEVRYSDLVVNTGNIKNKGTLEIENNDRGCRQEYNPATNTLEFRFY